MLEYFGNSHLYTAFELQRMALSPINMAAHAGKKFFTNESNPLSYTEYGKRMAAANELIERMTRRFTKPEFEIHSTVVNGKAIPIKEKIRKSKTFCKLLHFEKQDKIKPQEKLLIVAPMSGHYATLLRGTVEAFLPHFDVYITDWINAQDVPLYKGDFDLDDYIEYVQSFLQYYKKPVHVIGVCQPVVPVMAAVALMSSRKDPCAPKSMTLIGGPIDARENPTEVNRLAHEKSIEWFKHNVVTHVPLNYPGAMRPVYPGFLQLSGFMSMNLDRHIDAHVELFNHLVEGDGDSATVHKEFYNEYLSVMDISAEFYLQTVETVFQNYALPKGEMVSREKPVCPADIKNTALLTIEGERDDISGTGQTKAAHKICTGLPDSKKLHHLQKNVGHYGQFNGRRFREEIVPVVVKFIEQHS